MLPHKSQMKLPRPGSAEVKGLCHSRSFETPGCHTRPSVAKRDLRTQTCSLEPYNLYYQAAARGAGKTSQRRLVDHRKVCVSNTVSDCKLQSTQRLYLVSGKKQLYLAWESPFSGLVFKLHLPQLRSARLIGRPRGLSLNQLTQVTPTAAARTVSAGDRLQLKKGHALFPLFTGYRLLTLLPPGMTAEKSVSQRRTWACSAL